MAMIRSSSLALRMILAMRSVWTPKDSDRLLGGFEMAYARIGDGLMLT